MNIGFWGDGPWAHEALARLIKNKIFNVRYVVGRYSHYDEKLKSIAELHDKPFYRPENANNIKFLNTIASHSVDINVSMSYDQIIKLPLINSAPLGFINCHAGALPFYRGRNVLNWAIINGEEHFGITVHYIDEGIDTGDIICQEFIEILAEDDYQSVLKKAERSCPIILEEALVNLSKNAINKTKQSSIHPVGFYCCKRVPGDEKIDWNWSSLRVVDFIRGISFPAPCARTWVNGTELKILSAEIVNGAPQFIGVPGEVIGRCDKGNFVKTGDSYVLIKQISMLEHGVGFVNGIEIAQKPEFPVGTRFKSFRD